MGNCQAAEAAAVVIQHPGPGGKVERLYWPSSAAEVMRNNPGHYVALVTLRVVESDASAAGAKQLRLTRVKLLKPRDTLQLGQVYRLITSQEVTKALRERKLDKLKNLHQTEYITKSGAAFSKQGGTDSENSCQGGTSTSTQRSRHWQPSLQSIDEVGT